MPKVKKGGPRGTKDEAFRNTKTSLMKAKASKIRKSAIQTSTRSKRQVVSEKLADGPVDESQSSSTESCGKAAATNTQNSQSEVAERQPKRQRQPPHTSKSPNTTRKRPVNKSKSPKDDNLPPELRTAGLLANGFMHVGKTFGPFRGEIIDKKKPPTGQHSFVCSIKDSYDRPVYFYVHENDKQKCQWLKLVQAPLEGGVNNMVAYNSDLGVCYCAVKDINVGDEVLVVFQSDFGQKYPAFVDLATEKTAEDIKPLHSSLKSSEELKNDTESMRIENYFSAKDPAPVVVPEKTGLTLISTELVQMDNKNMDKDGETGAALTNVSTEDISGQDGQYLDNEGSNTDNKSCGRSSKKAIGKQVPPKGIPTENGGVKCSTCRKEFEDTDNFQKHTKEHLSKGKSIGCMSCEKIFSTKRGLAKHVRLHHRVHKCEECAIEFGNYAELRRHQRELHPMEVQHRECPICQKSFTRGYLKDHIESHKSDAFQCPKCHKNFSSRSNLRKHKRKHEPDYVPRKENRDRPRNHECHLCGKKFTSIYSLKVHQRIHTGERPFECEQCHWTFTQQSHLRRHIKVSHGIGQTTKKHQCSICHRSYSTPQVLETHVNAIHKGLRPYKCSDCPSTFTQQGHLFRHRREVHGLSSDIPESERKFVCKMDGCGQKFGLQTELNQHTMEHTGKHPHTCSKCNIHFSSRGNLRKHIRRVHLGERVDKKKKKNHIPYDCSLCGKQYPSASQLREHNRVHTGERISCDKCGQTFVQRSGLRKHIRCVRCPKIREDMHARGEEIEPELLYPRVRKWRCEVCEKCFTGPSDLRSHERVHTKEKPFMCEICEKGFSQPGNLKKHVRYVHQGEKRPKDKPRPRRYSCSLCAKSFMSSGDLSMHCRVHTGVKPFDCPECGMAFTQKGNLKKHIERWHGIHVRKRSSKYTTIQGMKDPEENQEKDSIEEDETLEKNRDELNQGGDNGDERVDTRTGNDTADSIVAQRVPILPKPAATVLMSPSPVLPRDDHHEQPVPPDRESCILPVTVMGDPLGTMAAVGLSLPQPFFSFPSLLTTLSSACGMRPVTALGQGAAEGLVIASPLEIARHLFGSAENATTLVSAPENQFPQILGMNDATRLAQFLLTQTPFYIRPVYSVEMGEYFSREQEQPNEVESEQPLQSEPCSQDETRSQEETQLSERAPEDETSFAENDDSVLSRDSLLVKPRTNVVMSPRTESQISQDEIQIPSSEPVAAHQDQQIHSEHTTEPDTETIPISEEPREPSVTNLSAISDSTHENVKEIVNLHERPTVLQQPGTLSLQSNVIVNPNQLSINPDRGSSDSSSPLAVPVAVGIIPDSASTRPGESQDHGALSQQGVQGGVTFVALPNSIFPLPLDSVQGESNTPHNSSMSHSADLTSNTCTISEILTSPVNSAVLGRQSHQIGLNPIGIAPSLSSAAVSFPTIVPSVFPAMMPSELNFASTSDSNTTHSGRLPVSTSEEGQTSKSPSTASFLPGLMQAAAVSTQSATLLAQVPSSQQQIILPITRELLPSSRPLLTQSLPLFSHSTTAFTLLSHSTAIGNIRVTPMDSAESSTGPLTLQTSPSDPQTSRGYTSPLNSVIVSRMSQLQTENNDTSTTRSRANTDTSIVTTTSSSQRGRFVPFPSYSNES